MTKKQIELLEDVLHDARTGWNIKVEFPASITEMIEARIAFNERMIKIHGMCEDPYLRTLKDEVFTLRWLKSHFEGK